MGYHPSVQASSDIETPAVSGRADLDLPSIVVLPLANQSNDEEQEYLVDGLTEDIIISLSAFKWLRVCPRNSAFSFKGKGELVMMRLGTYLVCVISWKAAHAGQGVVLGLQPR